MKQQKHAQRRGRSTIVMPSGRDRRTSGSHASAATGYTATNPRESEARRAPPARAPRPRRVESPPAHEPCRNGRPDAVLPGAQRPRRLQHSSIASCQIAAAHAAARARHGRGLSAADGAASAVQRAERRRASARRGVAALEYPGRARHPGARRLHRRDAAIVAERVARDARARRSHRAHPPRVARRLQGRRARARDAAQRERAVRRLRRRLRPAAGRAAAHGAVLCRRARRHGAGALDAPQSRRARCSRACRRCFSTRTSRSSRRRATSAGASSTSTARPASGGARRSKRRAAGRRRR